MENENENIRNIAKDIVENVINRSLKNIELIENMNCYNKPLSSIDEETDSVSDSTNKFVRINEDSTLLDVSLDDDIDLDAIKQNILCEKAKREKKPSSITIIKRLCCFCVFRK